MAVFDASDFETGSFATCDRPPGFITAYKVSCFTSPGAQREINYVERSFVKASALPKLENKIVELETRISQLNAKADTYDQVIVAGGSGELSSYNPILVAELAGNGALFGFGLAVSIYLSGQAVAYVIKTFKRVA